MKSFFAIVLMATGCASEGYTDIGEQSCPLTVECERPYICESLHSERPGCGTFPIYWGCYAQCEPCPESDDNG